MVRFFLLSSNTLQPIFLNMTPVSLTESAKREILDILSKKKIPEGYAVRIGARGSGCSGVSYVLGFDTQKDDDDKYDIDGIEVLISKKDFMHLIGVEVDFVEHEDEQGFVFNA